MRKYICITYHMAKLDGETAETCIDLPMDEKIADDILRAQRCGAAGTSRMQRGRLPASCKTSRSCRGTTAARFAWQRKATFGKGRVER